MKIELCNATGNKLEQAKADGLASNCQLSYPERPFRHKQTFEDEGWCKSSCLQPGCAYKGREMLYALLKSLIMTDKKG